MLRADEPLNLDPLLAIWRGIVGVVEAYENTVVGDGNDIWYTPGQHFETLEYSLGHGDCPAGCTSRDVWTFRIYPDCAVEYMGKTTR
ncbi:MAG: hypothetical protein AAF570_05325 [Bacteroidota bacterium]